MKLYWINQPGQERSHYLKFSLLHLARQSKVRFVSVDLSKVANYGIKDEIIEKLSTHAVLLFTDDCPRKLICLDNEDSFHEVCDVIFHVDYYFKAAYVKSLFKEGRFFEPYDWQRDIVDEYKARFQSLLEKHADQFHKILPLIPIPMDMGIRGSGTARYLQYARNLLSKWFKLEINELNYRLFKLRYDQVLGYRKYEKKYDLSAHDTLWGWPRNRYLLHQSLSRLSDEYRVSHSLKGDSQHKDFWQSFFTEEELQEIEKWSKQGVGSGVERVICESALNVYSSGKHWGWRQIMFISLMAGVPIFMDKPIYEPYFEFCEFPVLFKTENWNECSDTILAMTPQKIREIKEEQIRIFNKRLSPNAVGSYLLNSIGISL